MKKTMIALLSILVSGLLAQDVSGLIQQADDTHEAKQYEEVFSLLKQAEEMDAGNFEVIWRLSRAHFDFYDNSDDEAYSNEQIYKALGYAEKALAMKDDRAESHKWFAICIGKVGIIEGSEQKIKNSYKVAEHTLKAIELDPEDDGNYHVMGRWHFILADLSWIERKIASWVYATPPDASFEEGRDFFKKAITLDPEDIRNYVWLGKTYEELDDEDGASNAYKTAIGKTATNDSDRILQKEAKELLEDL
ncbi:MAG: hypothetical protein H8E64_06420 [Candidatus Marinimicrobia bacterium]|nr:hypothetical protein [Candidatus Neomarinimicrobiota bacterium]